MAKSPGASRHVELERKFDVGAEGGEAVTPSFDGLSSVGRTERLPTQWLEAVYYDTPAHDLARHRVTLRRRTGGPDEGWHLKLPGTDAGADTQTRAETRTEVRAPLHPDVPPDLRDTVLAIVRDRPLEPVARISTAREVTVLYGTGGAAIAEFCDDRVSACRLHDGRPGEGQDWREWELELVDPALPDAGDLFERLTRRVLDAGAAPAGHASKLAKTLGDTPAADALADPVHRAVAAQIERLLESDRAVRADAYDSVHQMRVATRQIRSLLQASEEEFGLTDDAWILSELQELAAILGTARDAEVLAERFSTALAALPPELIRGPVAQRLVDGAMQRYHAGRRRSLTAMRSARYFRLLDALEALVFSQPAAPAPRHASIAASYRKVRKSARAARVAAGTERDHAIHRIRKAAKRLRYIAAATGHAGVERRSKEIQTLLGEHQDSVVSRAHLLAAADAARAAGEDTFTYGVLYQREADLALRCEQELGGALKALRRSVD